MRKYYWEILGISSTKDEKVIKKAYSKKLREIDADKDIESFNELQEAFKQARSYAKNKKSKQLILKDNVKIKSIERETTNNHPYVITESDFVKPTEPERYSDAKELYAKKRDFIHQDKLGMYINQKEDTEKPKQDYTGLFREEDFLILNDMSRIDVEINIFLGNLLFNNNPLLVNNFLIKLDYFSKSDKIDYIVMIIEFINQNSLFINYFDVKLLLKYIDETFLLIENEELNKLRHNFKFEFFFGLFNDDDLEFEQLQKRYELRKKIMESFRYKINFLSSNKYINLLKKLVGESDEIVFYRSYKTFLDISKNEKRKTKNLLSILESQLFLNPNEQSTLLLYLFISFLYKDGVRITNNEIEIIKNDKVVHIKIDIEKMKKNLFPYRYYYLAYVCYRLGYKDKAIEYWMLEKDLKYFEWDKKIKKILVEEKINVDNLAVPIERQGKSEDLKHIIIGFFVLYILFKIVSLI